ncbi:MAG: hypothetical protein M1823_000549 [Watsoniomyces obsoletus]|nr:MAG: hypothetical protein M1823_000549 [Watsoniomyces obsoletus]
MSILGWYLLAMYRPGRTTSPEIYMEISRMGASRLRLDFAGPTMYVMRLYAACFAGSDAVTQHLANGRGTASSQISFMALWMPARSQCCHPWGLQARSFPASTAYAPLRCRWLEDGTPAPGYTAVSRMEGSRVARKGHHHLLR